MQVMSETLEVLNEVRGSSSLRTLHPLRLDRWHRALLGLPDHIYMQYDCATLLEQVQAAAVALRAMVDLLGPSGLPVEPQELAQRTVQTFRWYLPSTNSSDLIEFRASWDKESSSWKLGCTDAPSSTKSVDGLETALLKSHEWAAELGTSVEITETPTDEG